MTITVKYFGMIAEQVGKSEEMVSIDGDSCTTDDLMKACFADRDIETDFSMSIALNQSLVDSTNVKDGDEVAFLPPFAGG